MSKVARAQPDHHRQTKEKQQRGSPELMTADAHLSSLGRPTAATMSSAA
jgi:hypothetical protein